MTRTMFDSITPGNIPASASLVAGYVDGLYANIPAMRARFPHATVVEITVFARDDAGQVLDVETGDATPDQAPGWVQRRRAAGVDPTVYCNASTWPAVRAAFKAAGVAQPHYWVALYDGDPTIPAGAVAKQYRDAGPYDLSSVADVWPGVDTTPEVNVAMTQADADLFAQTLMGYKMDDPAQSGLQYTTFKDVVWTIGSQVNRQPTRILRTVPGAHGADVGVQIESGIAEAAASLVEAKLQPLLDAVAALSAKVDSIVAAGGPTGAAVQAAVQAAMQAEFAAAGKALEGAATPPAPAPGGKA